MHPCIHPPTCMHPCNVLINSWLVWVQVAPEKLATIRSEMPSFHLRSQPGHYVEILAGRHSGRRGVVSSRPFRVKFVDGSWSDYLRETDFKSSGLDEQ